jgi:hypothetical protein
VTAALGLLDELRHADHIIKIMLQTMSVQQQARLGAELEAAGVAGDSAARHRERTAVIAAATAPASTPQLQNIEEHAVDIITEADRAGILLRELFNKLDQAGDAAPAAAADINCFATCAARAVVLMREAADDIVTLVAEGGAA